MVAARLERNASGGADSCAIPCLVLSGACYRGLTFPEPDGMPPPPSPEERRQTMSDQDTRTPAGLLYDERPQSLHQSLARLDAQRAGLARRASQAKADCHMALRRADALVYASRLLVEESRGRIAQVRETARQMSQRQGVSATAT